MLALPAETSANLIGQVHLADCLDLCERVYRAGVRVDMILADLPYGTTACAWDTIIPFEPMWKAFKKIIKPRGAIVLTASQPFTSALVMSNPKMFRYAWVWDKVHKGNIFLASFQPLKIHEDVLVFSIESHDYYPQMVKGQMRTKGGGYSKLWQSAMVSSVNDDYYPVSIVKYSNADHTDKVHPTQKPVDLFRYLIRTYTQPNELVFDPTCGSGTTADAAREEGRRFIVGDSSSEYVQVTRNRLAAPYTPSFMPALDAAG